MCDMDLLIFDMISCFMNADCCKMMIHNPTGKNDGITTLGGSFFIQNIKQNIDATHQFYSIAEHSGFVKHASKKCFHFLLDEEILNDWYIINDGITSSICISKTNPCTGLNMLNESAAKRQFWQSLMSCCTWLIGGKHDPDKRAVSGNNGKIIKPLQLRVCVVLRQQLSPQSENAQVDVESLDIMSKGFEPS